MWRSSAPSGAGFHFRTSAEICALNGEQHGGHAAAARGSASRTRRSRSRAAAAPRRCRPMKATTESIGRLSRSASVAAKGPMRRPGRPATATRSCWRWRRPEARRPRAGPGRRRRCRRRRPNSPRPRQRRRRRSGRSRGSPGRTWGAVARGAGMSGQGLELVQVARVAGKLPSGAAARKSRSSAALRSESGLSPPALNWLRILMELIAKK